MAGILLSDKVDLAGFSDVWVDFNPATMAFCSLKMAFPEVGMTGFTSEEIADKSIFRSRFGFDVS